MDRWYDPMFLFFSGTKSLDDYDHKIRQENNVRIVWSMKQPNQERGDLMVYSQLKSTHLHLCMQHAEYEM